MAHTILSKTDRAIAAYLISVGAGTSADVYPEKYAGDKGFPDTIIFSRARMDPPDSGVYIVTTMVQVRTSPSVNVGETAAEKVAANEERVSNTFDAFMAHVGSGTGELAALITAAGGVEDFTVQNVSIITMEAGFDARGNAWLDTLGLELVVFPADA